MPAKSEPVDALEGGLTITAWITLWDLCHAPNGMGGTWRTTWPDGGCAVEQPALAVGMFNLINEMTREANKSGSN